MPDPQATRRLLALIRGHRLAEIVRTAARLRIPDLHVLVMPGGGERTRKAWTEVLRLGGFRLDDVRSLRGRPWQLILGSRPEAAAA